MDIVMPKMGESVSEGTILKWHKKQGDHVKRDEIIFEISTDKVDTEIPSPIEGVLSEIKFNEGDTVDVGTVVAVVDSGNEVKEQGTGKDKAVEEKEIVAVPAKGNEEQKVKQDSTEDIAVDTSPADREEEGKHERKPGGEIEIKMPKMGESVMEGTIIKWHKKAGDNVKKDEVMFEISTDKVDTEVPSPAQGTVSEILVAEQETVEVGTVVAKLYTGEAPDEQMKKGKAAEKAAPENGKQNITPPPETAKKEPEKEITPASNQSAEPEIKTSKFLSPLVMNIAKKENVGFDELDEIKGTGLEGRITKKDILAYIEERKSKPETKKEVTAAVGTAQPAVGYEPDYSDDEVEKLPMDNIRQKIMQHMVNSRDTSVHVSAMLEVDMTKIHNYIQLHKNDFLKKEEIKLTYLPFISHAAIKALKEYPLVNSSIEGSTIIRKKFINLGIAVAVEPTGLIVPNIKNADEKSIIGLTKSIADLANRTRNKKLTPDDITNGTFTITNYGVFGTIFGTPIINQPEVAILGVGTVTKKPVVIEVDGIDTIAIKPVMALTLSHDHRLIDGMMGGKFLKFIKDSLESFNEGNM